MWTTRLPSARLMMSLGSVIKHGPVILPVRPFGGAAVVEHPTERERRAEAFVEHQEELRRRVGAAVGEHVQDDFRLGYPRWVPVAAVIGRLVAVREGHMRAFRQRGQYDGDGGNDGGSLSGIAAHQDGNRGLDQEDAGSRGNASIDVGVFCNMLGDSA